MAKSPQARSHDEIGFGGTMSPMKSLISRAIKAVRGREVVISDGLETAQILALAYQKAFKPLLRGLLRFPIRAAKGGLVFLGPNVQIINSMKLKLGRFCYLGGNSYLDCTSIGGVELGDRVTIREGAWLQLTSKLSEPGTSIRIGNGTYIGPRSILGAGAPLVIGQHCQIGADVHFIAENHKFEAGKEIFDQGVLRDGIQVGDDCWIGNGVRILDGVSVGRGAVIGAGAVVTRSVPEYEVWAGIPARRIKSRSSQDSADPSDVALRSQP